MSDNLMMCYKSERYVKILMIIKSSDSDVSKLDFPYFPTSSLIIRAFGTKVAIQ
jgi:hypothetical protein